MATPLLTHHALPGALGPILVDVRTASRTAGKKAGVIVFMRSGRLSLRWAMAPS